MIAAVLLLIGSGWVAPVHAGPILATPAGLAPGTHFRFVFVTDGTTTATSSNITDYDNFVNTQAGGATYNGSTVTWQAIGSTATVNAIDHITGPQTDPVYLATGIEVAASTTTTSQGLWSGTLLHAINSDLTGTTPPNLGVWTGTTATGIVSPSAGLGGSPPGMFCAAGNSNVTGPGWAEEADFGVTANKLVYGVSNDLVVPSSVPEPSSWLTLGIGLGVTTVIGWSRHRRQQRRQRAVSQTEATE
jgi:hypothetical protein